MYGYPSEAEMFGDFSDGGGYPQRFLHWAYEKMGVVNPAHVLHLCSGSMRSGVCVDVRKETTPTVVADCRQTPFRDASFGWILADPPYSEEYAHNLYKTKARYPKPFAIVREAARLLVPGGFLGLLHFQVPYFRKPMKLLGTWGITQGVGYNIRAWSLLQRAR